MLNHKGEVCETVEEENLEDEVCCCVEEVHDAINFALSRYSAEVQEIVREQLGLNT